MAKTKKGETNEGQDKPEGRLVFMGMLKSRLNAGTTNKAK
jgi:hypothetical protein